MLVQAESTMRNVCGDFIADKYQTDRGVVALTLEEEVREVASEKFRAVITKLQLVNVDRPSEYEQAVLNRENAKNEIDLAQNEEFQALTQANTQVDIAVEERTRILDSAETQAEIRRNQSIAETDGIIDRFTQLADLYGSVKVERNLTVKGILTYISNEIFMDDVTIAVDTPARITFRDDEL